MADEKETFEGWCVLEIMGHRRLGGYVTESTIAGGAFLRIDIPGPDGATVATQYYAPASVYAITPCSEEAARGVAVYNKPQPVHRWELPQRRETADSPVQETYNSAIDDDIDDDADDDFDPLEDTDDTYPENDMPDDGLDDEERAVLQTQATVETTD